MDLKYTCKVCGNTDNNFPFRAKELMLGLNTEFQYFECFNCKCIQIDSIPQNIADYYPQNYLSFEKNVSQKKVSRLKRSFKSILTNHYTGNSTAIGFILSSIFNNPLPLFKRGLINTNSKILDIGCGTGKLLFKMQQNGYNYLEGIDLFIEKEINHAGVSIYKKSLFDLSAKYDLIMLNHSFEHMENPKEVLIQLKKHLSNTGSLMIRIPIANSYAWRKYGVDWVQLDAPRHYFLHTTKSMNILCNETGYKINNIEFESSAFQFKESEKYIRGLAFNSTDNIFSKNQIKEFDKMAKQLNAINDGDTACFYISRNN